MQNMHTKEQKEHTEDEQQSERRQGGISVYPGVLRYSRKKVVLERSDQLWERSEEGFLIRISFPAHVIVVLTCPCKKQSNSDHCA